MEFDITDITTASLASFNLLFEKVKNIQFNWR